MPGYSAPHANQHRHASPPSRTLASGAILLVAAFLSISLEAAQAEKSPVSIRIDVDSKHQEIDNFGASDCWSMQKIGAWSLKNRNRVADLLFSMDKGIGLSCWRFNLGGGIDREHTSESWRAVETFEAAEGEYDWNRQAEEQWFLFAARERGVEQFIAFVNSPPTRMTRNGLTYCADDSSSTNLKEGYEGQYARYLADILRHFRDNPDESKRVAFDWVSPVNEPQWPWIESDQEGCRMGNEDIKAVYCALDAELTKQGLDTKILGVESAVAHGMHSEHRGLARRYGQKYGDYLDEFAGDPSVNRRMGHVLCNHSYFMDHIPHKFTKERLELREKFEEHPDWKYWQTEYCLMRGPEGKGGGGRDLTMETALDVARVIYGDLVLCNASAWQWWTAVSPCDYKDGLIYTDYQKPGDEETIYPAKLLWAFGNFSRFIRPGARRVELKGADDLYGLMGSAYLSADEGNLVVVFVNAANSEKPVSLDIDGLPRKRRPAAFVPHITSASDDLKEYAPVAAKEPYTVPARSVVTLVGALPR